MNINFIIDGLSSIDHPGIKYGVLSDLEQLFVDQAFFSDEELYEALEFQAEVLDCVTDWPSHVLPPNEKLLVHSAAYALRSLKNLSR